MFGELRETSQRRLGNSEGLGVGRKPEGRMKQIHSFLQPAIQRQARGPKPGGHWEILKKRGGGGKGRTFVGRERICLKNYSPEGKKKQVLRK